VTPDAESGFYFHYYTSPAYNSSPGNLYPDVLLGGTDNQATFGPPGFSFGPQAGGPRATVPIPAPNTAAALDLTQRRTPLMTAVRVFPDIDKSSSNPNTWNTFIYYNIADESDGTACPETTMQKHLAQFGWVWKSILRHGSIVRNDYGAVTSRWILWRSSLQLFAPLVPTREESR